jgi:hypothetical protein
MEASSQHQTLTALPTRTLLTPEYGKDPEPVWTSWREKSLAPARIQTPKPSNQYLFVCLLWHCDPTRVMASSFLRFLDHTQRSTTVGRTPLDEWSAHRRDLYLTTHNTYNRQTSMPPVGFEPMTNIMQDKAYLVTYSSSTPLQPLFRENVLFISLANFHT